MQLPTLFRRREASTPDSSDALREVVTGELVTVDESDPNRAVISVKGEPLCRDRAKALIHKYAVFGTVWACIPVPMATSAGLTLLETHLIYWIARIYGEHPTRADILMTAGGLELASVALKAVAIEGAALVPVVGMGIKAGIAGSVVEGIGHAIVSHYEAKYPGRLAAAAA